MTGDRPDLTAPGDVASTLWRLRELLENLLFKVTVERLVLGSGQTRWLVEATRELDTALHDFHTAEVLRAVTTDGLAGQLGVPPGSTLAVLADAAAEPWTTVLHDHRDALRALVAEVDVAAEDAAAAPERAAVDDANRGLGDDLVRPAALRTMARVRQSSLVDFLR